MNAFVLFNSQSGGLCICVILISFVNANPLVISTNILSSFVKANHLLFKRIGETCFVYRRSEIMGSFLKGLSKLRLRICHFRLWHHAGGWNAWSLFGCYDVSLKFRAWGGS
jgi:hypothetical protein